MNKKNQDLKQIKQTNNLWNFHLGEFGEIISISTYPERYSKDEFNISELKQFCGRDAVKFTKTVSRPIS